MKTESVIGDEAQPKVIKADVEPDRFPDDFLLGSATSAFQVIFIIFFGVFFQVFVIFL